VNGGVWQQKQGVGCLHSFKIPWRGFLIQSGGPHQTGNYVTEAPRTGNDASKDGLVLLSYQMMPWEEGATVPNTSKKYNGSPK